MVSSGLHAIASQWPGAVTDDVMMATASNRNAICSSRRSVEGLRTEFG
jgi:hypothetical protein